MASLLLWKEHPKQSYNRYSYGIQPVVRFLFALCTMVGPSTDIGYVVKLKNPLVIPPVYLVSALLSYGAIVFLTGCLMIAHVYAVSLEIALIAIVLILAIAILYHGFKPGDSYLMVLTSLVFLFKIPYVVPLLVRLDGSLISVIPVGCGVFLYYLLVYVERNAGILAAGDSSVDIVQKYSQILKSVFFNRTMMVMIATRAAGVIMVYLMRRLSMDYTWVVAVVVGTATEPLAIFVGDFVFEVSVSVGWMVLGLALSVAIAAVSNFFALSVDYIRTECAQLEGGDYYYYVKVAPKITVSIPDVKVQKISTYKRGTRGRDSYQ